MSSISDLHVTSVKVAKVLVLPLTPSYLFPYHHYFFKTLLLLLSLLLLLLLLLSLLLLSLG